MLERALRFVFVVVLFVGISICYAQNSQIAYTATDLGGGSWEYNYSVTNLGLSQPIRSFTVWFDYGICSNLMITTTDPPGADWDEMIFPEDDVLHDGPGYDALALSGGIPLGQTVSGFSVTFDWLGLDEPGSQFYQIFDPDNNFALIAEGTTVPEPATSLLALIGASFVFGRNKR